jgi:dolichol-phosphate mannosyltransferase
MMNRLSFSIRGGRFIKQWLLKRVHLVQKGWGGRLFSFLCIGGFAALINLLCFSIVYYRMTQAINVLPAYVLAFLMATEVSIVANFIPNDRITFRNLPGQCRSWGTRCLRFHMTSIGGISLTLGFSFTFLHLFHILALLAQAAALLIATAFNFVFHHLFTYRHIQKTTGTPNNNWLEKCHTIEPGGQATMKTLIIIPTYNEVENLPLLLKEIFFYAPQTDVLIVDDNSPDGTGALADEIRRQDARVHVLHRPGKLGLGTAYVAGFQYALEQGYDAAFEMDADFSHDPRALPDFLSAIEQADVVIGSRYILGGSTPNWSLMRRLISGSGNIFARFMLGIPIRDCTSGFRCYRRSVLQCLGMETIQSQGFAFQVELTYRAMQQGFRMIETPITFVDRRLGKSKMSHTIVIEAFAYVLRARFGSQSAVRASAAGSNG